MAFFCNDVFVGGCNIYMAKIGRLKKNYEFKYVYNKGKVYPNNLLVLYIVGNRSDFNRMGVSVSKKVGKSVVRNKVRRRIKECYRLNCDKIKSGYNIIFIARVNAKEASYKEIEKSMMSLFRRSRILLNER